MREGGDRILQRVVQVKEKGSRLDSYLAVKGDVGLSRSQIKKLIEAGAVCVNEELVSKPGQRIKAGDVLRVHLPIEEDNLPQAEDIALKIVYEDDDILVVDKPAGMVVHPAPGHRSGTLVNALLHHNAALTGIGDYFRPGIVHRLDKDTSGLLVIAKKPDTYKKMIQKFKRQQVQRIYLALVKGQVSSDSGLVDAPLSRHSVRRKQMAVNICGKDARTRFFVLERFREYTLLKVELETGRTHQIRVHLSYIGHAVVGDSVYGKTKNTLGLQRQALHASQLEFSHPCHGGLLTFTSPLPVDMRLAIEQLKLTKRK